MLAWLRGLRLPKLEALLAPSAPVASLSEVCATALPYLAVADYLQPKTVAWPHVHAAPCALVWQRAANCALAMRVLEQRGFRDAVSVVKPGELAVDIVPARARGLLWLLMRQVMLRMAGCAHGGGAELLAWANSKAAGSSGIKIARFDDPRLHNGVFLLIPFYLLMGGTIGCAL